MTGTCWVCAADGTVEAHHLAGRAHPATVTVCHPCHDRLSRRQAERRRTRDGSPPDVAEELTYAVCDLLALWAGVVGRDDEAHLAGELAAACRALTGMPAPAVGTVADPPITRRSSDAGQGDGVREAFLGLVRLARTLADTEAVKVAALANLVNVEHLDPVRLWQVARFDGPAMLSRMRRALGLAATAVDMLARAAESRDVAVVAGESARLAGLVLAEGIRP